MPTQHAHGVFTTRPGVLSNDFFVNLLDMGTVAAFGDRRRARRARPPERRAEVDRHRGRPRVRLELAAARAIAEVYGSADAQRKFVDDFVAAWTVSPRTFAVRIAILTFDGFNELDSFIALGLLNRLGAQGWKAEIASPPRTSPR